MPHTGALRLRPAVESGGIAGSAIYTNSEISGFLYNPANGPAASRPILFDDVVIMDSVLGGATALKVTKLTVAVIRLANAPATTVSLYATTMTTEVTDPDTEIDTPPTLLGSLPLPANGAMPIAQGITAGDGIATLFTVDLNRTVIEGPNSQVAGAFAIGLQLSSSSTLQGWALTTGPDSNVDAFWTYNTAATPIETIEFFGGDPLASFYVIIEGTPVFPPNYLCPANIVSNSPNPQAVDTDDLVALITTWGPCPALPAACPANIVSNAPNPQAVDTDDLVALITTWGPCPPQTPNLTGACCVPSGGAYTCSQLTPAACTSAGGQFQGTGILCNGASVCPLPEDECAGAQVLPTSGVDEIIDVTDYSTNVNDPTGCGEAFPRGGGWWYSYTATANGTLTVTTCGSAAPEDTVISIYTGSCASLTQVACDDDACDAPALGRSSVSLSVTTGTTYLIFVDTYSGGGSDGGVFGPVRVQVTFN